MANSLVISLLGMLDTGSVGRIADVLGEPEQSVTRGVQTSIAAVLGVLASKSQDPGTLRRIMDLAPSTLSDVTWSRMTSGLSDPVSPLVSLGNRLLSGLFGDSESVVTNAISADSGLRHGATSRLMAMAALVVISFLGKHARDNGITMSSLGNIFQQESPAIQRALPAGLSDLFWPRVAVADSASSVVAQAVEKEESSSSWIVALPIAALLLGLFWLFTHSHRTTTQVSSVTTGAANRDVGEIAGLRDFVKRTLPNNVTLKLPENGVETRLLAFIQDSGATPDQTTWFDFDRLVFDTGSARLRPESQEQLDNVAAILLAYPNVHVKVEGYTDNVGGTEQNLRLSQSQANSVVAELVRKGVSAERLDAEGYGEQYPIADNSTEEGRAKNRRVSMRITEK
jgi:OmpA-OmpF porin, OOP family